LKLHWNRINPLVFALAPTLLVVAGCGGRVSGLGGGLTSEGRPEIHASATRIDTNGTTQFKATLANGEPAQVEWRVAGGDPAAGTGTISKAGLYTPPSYLTRDAVTVSVTAQLTSESEGGANAADSADSADLTVTPGFLQPLTPENLSLGANGSVTVSGSMTEVGGSGGIRFTLASDTAGTPSEMGSLSGSHCVHGSIGSANPAYTVCTVTYTAPAALQTAASVYIVAAITGNGTGSGVTRSWSRVLLNASGINSNPATHQAHLAVPVQLGSSSGNNSDYDASLGQLSDCCGGTLGALLQDTSGAQFVLSNNHVLARSDQAIAGETIIQPGLIDNGCTPYGFGPGTTPVATLTGYPELSSAATNVDAAIARVTPGAVDPRGNILELGARQVDGTLAAAPPGISSTGGKGETATLGMMVAKSGRTTGLTCAAVSAVSVDVLVDYFTDCAETSHSLTKTFTNQMAIAGTNFSDAGDSGALVVDSANAEPVGLFFAGGTDVNGVEHAIANPVGDVIATLNTQVPGTQGPASYGFVGGTDHPVACLSYDRGSDRSKFGDENLRVAGLPRAERERIDSALPLAQLLINPATGIARVSGAVSRDHPGEAAIAVYVEAGAAASGSVATLAANLAAVPASIGGVPTVVLAGNGASGEAGAVSQPRAGSLSQALAMKQRNSALLLKSNPAIFGVGVGESLDNPAEAALILFVDRKMATGKVPAMVDGVRVRVILMDRLHVTRSHGTPGQISGMCPSSHEPRVEVRDSNPLTDAIQLPESNPFADTIRLDN
jgi:hypothetical protein